jgi:hypothetical protein
MLYSNKIPEARVDRVGWTNRGDSNWARSPAFGQLCGWIATWICTCLSLSGPGQISANQTDGHVQLSYSLEFLSLSLSLSLSAQVK